MAFKSNFPEWYGHKDDTVRKIVTEGSICFDANALLDLYRVNRGQREEILVVLKGVADRIFIPYQAAWEFHKNRLSAVRNNHDRYKALVKSTHELVDENLKQLHDKKLREDIKELFKASSKAFKKVVEEWDAQLAKLRDEHTISFQEVLHDDPVLKALDSLLGSANLGVRPAPDILEDRRKAALDRLGRGIPPGFEDADKDDPTGDYLIWCELLDHAENSGRPLLFVTNDKKVDWYRAPISGRSLGPRPELVVEMRERSPETLYHQADLGSFLFYAKEYLGLAVEDDTITTVENIEPTPPPRPAAAVDLAYPKLAKVDPNLAASIAALTSPSLSEQANPTLAAMNKSILDAGVLSQTEQTRQTIAALNKSILDAGVLSLSEQTKRALAGLSTTILDAGVLSQTEQTRQTIAALNKSILDAGMLSLSEQTKRTLAAINEMAGAKGRPVARRAETSGTTPASNVDQKGDRKAESSAKPAKPRNPAKAAKRTSKKAAPEKPEQKT